MRKSRLHSVKVGGTCRFAKTVGETDIAGEIKAVAEYIMRRAKQLSSSQR